MDIIQTEIARIKELRANYDALIADPNSRLAIEAYHLWYDESSVVFSRYLNDGNKEYNNFTNVDNNGNGYVLRGNYQKIRKDFCVLVDKLERGDFCVDKPTIVECAPNIMVSSKKRIFISHASKDKDWPEEHSRFQWEDRIQEWLYQYFYEDCLEYVLDAVVGDHYE